MELYALRCFCVLAELEHMSRAATRLQMAQPSLSRVLRQLEQELHCRLFDRVGRGIRLNRQGQLLYTRARQALADLDEVKADLLAIADNKPRTITLLVISGLYLLPHLFSQIRQRHPNINLSVIRQEAAGHTPKWDISIHASVQAPHSGRQTVIAQDTLGLLVPEDHRLADREAISLADAAREPFISRPKADLMGQIIHHYCQMAGFEPQVVVESEDGDLTHRLVAASVGVAFMPPPHRSVPHTKFLPITYPSCTRYLIAEHRSDRPEVLAVMNLMQAMPFQARNNLSFH